jgi:hypothetical protein
LLSAVWHPQPLAQAHDALAPDTLGVAARRQPQAHSLPGQVAQVQGELQRQFMSIPFLGGRTRRVRGKGFWEAGPRMA